MSENKKVLFIINKYAGTGYNPQVEAHLVSHCSKLHIKPSIEFTQGRYHATELASQAAQSKTYEVIFAVGGDGTVNEVAQGLVHTSQAMGILPCGSGNGLARHLGISMNIKKAVAQVGSDKCISMDSFLVNDKLSVNVSGIGFDGHIASLFGKGSKRGLIGYTGLVIKEFFGFREFPVNITIDGITYDKHVFVLAFANSSQFGNNARVSPLASVSDGLLDVCFIRKVPLSKAAGFAQKMFTGQIHKSSLVEIVKGKQLTLSFAQAMPYHVDGEAMTPAQDFSIAIQPASVRMIVPEDSGRV